MTIDTSGTATSIGTEGRDAMSGMGRDPSRNPPAGNTGGMAPSGRDPLVDRAATSAHQTIDRVAAKVGPAVERVRYAAQDSAQNLQTKLTDLDAMRSEWTDSAREYVRERPMTALGVAVLAGFLLSRWIRTS